MGVTQRHHLLNETPVYEYLWYRRSLALTGTAALEEDAQILRVIEAYCTGASLHQTSTGVCLCKNNGQIVSLTLSLDCASSTADKAMNHACPLICVYVYVCVCVCARVCSGAERVRPSGAPARGREDHCGGDEEQRADSYWGKVRILLLWKIGFHFLGFVIICIWIVIFSVIRFRNVILILFMLLRRESSHSMTLSWKPV